ncbi:MAG: tetratricopeptide repeat protein, partial [Gemmataceae bacterium]
PPRGEAFLLARSRTEEQAGRKDPARAAMEVLLKLAPASLPGHDRLACLYYRDGDPARAVDLLAKWRSLAPADHWPLVRRAVIEQERGDSVRRAEAIEHALSLTRGRLRAAVAYLGATLTLRDACKLPGGKRNFLPDVSPEAAAAFGGVTRLLEECLRDEPAHAEALATLAAVRSVRRDAAGLAELAPRMDRPDVTDAKFQYLAAVCHLAAGRHDEAVRMGLKAAADGSIASEARFVAACAQVKRGAADEAVKLLEPVTRDTNSPSLMYARALLGQLCYQREEYDDAIRHWSAVDPACRARWGLDEPLRQMVLLAGLQAMKTQRFEQAAERFREAGKLGLRERRLGGLITLALVKAGQKLLYDKAGG